MTCGVELCKRGERGVCAAVTVRGEDCGEMYTRGAYVRKAEFHTANVLIDPCRVRADVSVAKLPVDYPGRKQLHLMSGCDDCKIVLKALQINRRVSGHICAASGRKEKLPLRGVRGRQCQ